MAETTSWIRDRFPILYEGGEAKAVLVDIGWFTQMELIIDNLLNREEEPEDAILAASTVLQRLVARARQEPSSSDWERELDEL
ncbi:MAG: hypothetical protein H8D78_14820 [Chloroflexi bacterium]|nr:hypothetical protein [Chloroflexota bacterium]